MRWRTLNEPFSKRPPVNLRETTDSRPGNERTPRAAWQMSQGVASGFARENIAEKEREGERDRQRKGEGERAGGRVIEWTSRCTSD